MSDPKREPPLHAADFQSDFTNPEFAVNELSGFGHIDLRGDPNDQAFLDAVRHCTGLTLPASPNTRTGNDEMAIVWLSPDQWMLLVAQGTEKGLEEALRSGLNSHITVTDISSGQTVLSLSGSLAETVIRKSCPYDVGSLSAERCTQTIFAKTQVLLWRQAENEFQLVVRRSFADYLYQWLMDACR